MIKQQQNSCHDCSKIRTFTGKGSLSIVFLFIITLLTCVACNVCSKDLPAQDALRRAIAKSISLPFNKGDTVVYESFIGICGNSSKEELDKYYEPLLGEQPYADVLQKNIGRTTLFTGEGVDSLVLNTCKNREDFPVAYERFEKNKVLVSVTGEAIASNKVAIYERYTLNNELVTIQKHFKYVGDKWTYKLISNEKQKLN